MYSLHEKMVNLTAWEELGSSSGVLANIEAIMGVSIESTTSICREHTGMPLRAGCSCYSASVHTTPGYPQWGKGP